VVVDKKTLQVTYDSLRMNRYLMSELPFLVTRSWSKFSNYFLELYILVMWVALTLIST